jgi:4-phospho-D-threonate 3-dehydrogenase / 4-phospho-D-erythronate 3-dehydrogenase
MKTPVVALCLGDPAGIGPEIVARALGEPAVHAGASVVAVGPRAALERARALVGACAEIVPTTAPRADRSAADRWLLAEVPTPSEPIPDATPTRAGGQAAIAALVRALELVQAGEADAIAAAPSNKRALHLAGLDYEDHTAFLGHLTNTPDPILMPVSGSLRVVSVTNHVSMRQTCDALSRDLVLRVTRGTAATLLQMGIARPRLAVAALNPHAGEGGDFGDEEIRHITPAVEAARAEGLDVTGPFPADSLFTRDKLAQYDAFVTMYHDQGRIAQKALAFGTSVPISAGLPFFFASVGHGTAYDIAWQGRAGPTNLLETLRLAAAAARTGVKGRQS